MIQIKKIKKRRIIRMKEAEARLEHGWVTVQGTNSVVTNNKE